MLSDLSDSQIALLCSIGENDRSKSDIDRKSDLEHLLAEGYVQQTARHPDSVFELTAKAIAFLGERGAGLNEA
jgi:hypothetical protein